MHTFQTAREIVTGLGCVRCAGTRARALGTRVLLVTGRRAMRASGTTDALLALLADANLPVVLFEEVEHDPDLATIDAGRKLCRDEACDVVIGLGGGSAIDAAKAIAGLAHEASPTVAYQDGKAITAPALPLVAIPTTSGTGSEATKVAVLTNAATRVKKSIRADTMWPAVAIVDPELTVSCPPAVTAASGMDALVQAIDSFTSIHATPLTDALAYDAACRLIRALEAAYDDGQNLDAREQCAYGSRQAGMALANARLGAVHGIAHPLGARCGLAHGVACALLMPPVMRLNAPHVGDKYARLSAVAGGDIIAFVERLLDRLGLLSAFHGPSVSGEEVVSIVEESMASGSLKANPTPVTEEDVMDILEALPG